MALKPALLQPVVVLNLRNHIVQQLRDAILNGVFKPGTRLVESGIADQLDVSRAPVREALSALEQEGLLVNVPRRGHFVIEFTERDIEEIYSLRLLLEIEALRRAINRVTNQDLAEMQNILDDLDIAAHQKTDPEKIIALDLSFHELVCRAADHKWLYSAWDNLRVHTRLLMGITSRTHYDAPDQPRSLHQGILHAICIKDLKNAEAGLTDHILDAQRRATSALRALYSRTIE